MTQYLNRQGYSKEPGGTPTRQDIVERLKTEIIEPCLPTKNKRIGDFTASGEIKNVCKQLLREEVGSGEVIQAMSEAGFKVQTTPGHSDASFNLSKREFTILFEAAHNRPDVTEAIQRGASIREAVALVHPNPRKIYR